MRRQQIEYCKDLPIKIQYVNLQRQPILWQDSLRVIYVLRGNLIVGVENESYQLAEGAVDLINPDEVHSFEASEENAVLILDIDPMFFEKYYDGARDIFYYTGTTESDKQHSEEYRELKRLVGIIFYEWIMKFDDYEDKIEENLVRLMYHLLNHFHYLYYEAEELEDDEVLERYHRIVKYIGNNYMNKVSLQELAEQEYLTSQYLSFKIKETLGLGFNEYLNQVRVEESTKLLLDTEKSISEISADVGFSHVRYYNKHFKLHYGLTPVQYRKKFKVSQKIYSRSIDIAELDSEEALTKLIPLIEDYERFDYDNRILKADIDFSKEPMGFFNPPNTVDLGNIYLLLEEENRRILEETQREMDLEYAIVRGLFSEDMDIYRDANHRFINWTRVENILDYLFDIGLTPLILTENTERYILDDFLDYFDDRGEELSKLLFEDLESMEHSVVDTEIHPYSDKIEMASYILCHYLKEGQNISIHLIDEIHKSTILDNDSFFGGRGVWTNNYLKKPSYYAYMLLTLMKGEVLFAEEGCLVTACEEGYRIMLYNPAEIDELQWTESDFAEKYKARKLSLNLSNLETDMQVTRYSLDRENGSVYDKWMDLNAPERLDDDNWELLKEYVHPKVDFFFLKKQSVHNILTTVQPFGLVVYILNRY